MAAHSSISSSPSPHPISHDTSRALGIAPGQLRGVHHITLHVKNMNDSRHFYGTILGLQELVGDDIPSTLREAVSAGTVANFRLPDNTILDLFWKPTLYPPHPDPSKEFTRAGHLAFDISPDLFEAAVQLLQQANVTIDHGPVSRPTGRGIYFYDPDGFLLEIRCDRT
ncbi:MAG: VOC family protein [Cyanobacteria bacterium P01_E01_bin.6]